jgi:hypothetical protein
MDFDQPMPGMTGMPPMGGGQMCPVCGQPMMGGMPPPMPDQMGGAPNMPMPGGGGQIDPMLLQMLMSGGAPAGGAPGGY